MNKRILLLLLFVSSQAQGAMQFTAASSQSVNFGNIMNLGTSDFTLCAWINTNTSQKGNIISKRHSTGSLEQMAMSVGYTNNLGNGTASKQIGYFFYAGGSIPTAAQDAHTTNDIVDGNPHHVAVIRINGTQPKIYVDGISQALTIDGTATTNVNCDSVGSAYIGQGDGNVSIFDGLIDDVRVYNRALSSSELLTLAKSGQRVVLTTGLVLYPPLDDGPLNTVAPTGTIVLDRSPSRTNGTTVNGPVWKQSLFLNYP